MRCEVCGKEISVLNSKDYTCPKCGFEVYKPSNCDIPLPQGFGKQEGWICPVCGRGVAPWVDYCPCQSDWKITYGTGTNINGFASVDESIQYAKERYENICEELKS
jgi:predicted RNA-binding Zn-ribbon protein involved in translation (DUF1610 family)